MNTLEQILPKLALDDDTAGGAVVVYQDGHCVVSSGFGQANAHTAWTVDTLSVNFSVGKGVLATLVAVLVSLDVLDYDAPIARYWAAFAQNGKAHITIKDVLTHTAGLYNIKSVMDSNDEIADWCGMLEKVARMPISTPKGQDTHAYVSAYSALVSGFVLGGTIEKATQMPLQQALDTYLAKPLDIQGALFFGLPQSLHDTIALPVPFWHNRAARHKPTIKKDSAQTLALYQNLPIAPLWQNKTSVLDTPSINRLYFDTSQMNMQNYKDALLVDDKAPIAYYSDTILAACIPAANGVSSARALATIYAMHVDGTFGDAVLIKPSVLTQMRQIYTNGLDAVMPANMRWRLGFHRLFSLQNAPNAYGHMGYNGSVAFVDLDKKISCAFIHNFDTTMLSDVRQFIVSELALQW